MAWRDELRPASIRGVPCEVETAKSSIGRRYAIHEYPQRDIPFAEDMGRRRREHQFEAFVIGPDYMTGRDALIKAIDEEGHAQIVHPYFGTLLVAITDCQVGHSTKYGGMATFSISFLEAGERIEPNSETDTDLVLETQTEATEDAIAEDFNVQFTIVDKSDFVVNDALNSANEILDIPAMDIGEPGWIRADPTNELNALLPENLSASLLNPMAFARGILAQINQATSLIDLLNFSVAPVAASVETDSRVTLNNNRVMMTNLVQQAATMRRINDIARTEVQTIDDALIARSEIVQRADGILLNESTGQTTADAILQLRTDAVQHFASITADLPKLVSVTPKAVRPAIVAAHDWYGDDWAQDSREEELIARNKIRHPGFVPPGRPLYLLG